MKKVMAAALTAAMILSMASVGVTAADTKKVSSKTTAAQQVKDKAYTLKIVGGKLQFIKGGKVIKTISLKSSKITLVKSKAGGIAVQVTDSKGKTVRVTLGSQKDVSISGKMDELVVSKNVPKTANIELTKEADVKSLKISAAADVNISKGAEVSTMKVSAAAKVDIEKGAEVSDIAITSKSADVNVAKGATVDKVTTVSKGAVSGVSSNKVTTSSGSNSSNNTATSGNKDKDKDRPSSNNNSGGSTGGNSGTVNPTPTPTPTPEKQAISFVASIANQVPEKSDPNTPGDAFDYNVNGTVVSTPSGRTVRNSTVTLSGNNINVAADFAHMGSYLSDDPEQAAMGKAYWLGVLIKTDVKVTDLTYTSAGKTEKLTADDVKNAKKVSTTADDNTFIVWIRAEEVLKTPKTIKLSADGKADTTITINVTRKDAATELSGFAFSLDQSAVSSVINDSKLHGDPKHEFGANGYKFRVDVNTISGPGSEVKGLKDKADAVIYAKLGGTLGTDFDAVQITYPSNKTEICKASDINGSWKHSVYTESNTTYLKFGYYFANKDVNGSWKMETGEKKFSIAVLKDGLVIKEVPFSININQNATLSDGEAPEFTTAEVIDKNTIEINISEDVKGSPAASDFEVKYISNPHARANMVSVRVGSATVSGKKITLTIPDINLKYGDQVQASYTAPVNVANQITDMSENKLESKTGLLVRNKLEPVTATQIDSEQDGKLDEQITAAKGQITSNNYLTLDYDGATNTLTTHLNSSNNNDTVASLKNQGTGIIKAMKAFIGAVANAYTVTGYEVNGRVVDVNADDTTDKLATGFAICISGAVGAQLGILNPENITVGNLVSVGSLDAKVFLQPKGGSGSTTEQYAVYTLAFDNNFAKSLSVEEINELSAVVPEVENGVTSQDQLESQQPADPETQDQSKAPSDPEQPTPNEEETPKNPEQPTPNEEETPKNPEQPTPNEEETPKNPEQPNQSEGETPSTPEQPTQGGSDESATLQTVPATPEAGTQK